MRYLAALLVVFLIVVATPLQAQEPKGDDDILIRLEALEQENEALEVRITELEELTQSLAIMLAVNYTGDCIVEVITFGILMDAPQRSQAECLNGRVAFFDNLPEADRPFTQGISARPGG